MKTTSTKIFTILKWFVEVNFYLSVVVLITAGFLAISDNGSVFEFNADLYGPLANNLRIMLIYLAVTEAFLCIGCILLGKNEFFMLIGFSLVLMTVSLKVYGVINDMEVDPNLSIFFIYTGLSHLAFGLLAYLMKANRPALKTRFHQSL
ncbi:hypothetical protein [Methylomicrobium sp. Wu6]|uniref:hypothetical protein n=1 Tax=Methylomicrobium sp. Wu6 TaxID=3107928 RepID=UPI002DD69EF9|nr:hypothetical protein [Methylomicrobium sp. Wu6]MEC4746904.1 hypothetical protein [Methylomicrobium sp. Wu6]